jgi:hypothetical protein
VASLAERNEVRYKQGRASDKIRVGLFLVTWQYLLLKTTVCGFDLDLQTELSYSYFCGLIPCFLYAPLLFITLTSRDLKHNRTFAIPCNLAPRVSRFISINYPYQPAVPHVSVCPDSKSNFKIPPSSEWHSIRTPCNWGKAWSLFESFGRT